MQDFLRKIAEQAKAQSDDQQRLRKTLLGFEEAALSLLQSELQAAWGGVFQTHLIKLRFEKHTCQDRGDISVDRWLSNQGRALFLVFRETPLHLGEVLYDQGFWKGTSGNDEQCGSTTLEDLFRLLLKSNSALLVDFLARSRG